MKELSIEEKAKAYDEALKVANKYKDTHIMFPSIKDEMFSELKESEDERVRKALKEYFINSFQNNGVAAILGVHIKDIFAWLEKQGEQNTNHKTMFVKFICKKDWHGIGDYCCGKTYNGYPCEKEQNGYDIYDDNHVPTFCDEDFIDEYFNIITEEKQGEQKPVDKIEPKFKIGQIIKKEGFNIGFTIVAIEDGFYYNSVGDHFPFTDQDNWELIDKKPAWSEEDENMLTDAEYLMCVVKMENRSDNEYQRAENCIAWLKSLRPQSQWKPSEEQMEALESATENCAYSEYQDCLRELIEQLKKLKE